MFATGPLTSLQKKALAAVEAAKSAVMLAVKEGMSAKELDAIARKVLKTYGMEKNFTHALGHGVGLEVHEGITLSSRDDRVLMKNEVIAIEPGVYFPGKFGVRVEEMVVVR